MHDIPQDILAAYGMDEGGFVRMTREAYAFMRDGKKAILKPCALTPERIRFVHGAKEHLVAKGFDGVDRYLCTVDGEAFFEREGCCYIAVEAPEGRELSLESIEQMESAARMLARFHLTAQQYQCAPGSQEKDELGRMPENYRKRIEELKKIKKNAGRHRGRVDSLFMENVDHYFDMGMRALAVLSGEVYDNQVARTREDRAFCHKDIAGYNILVRPAGDMSLVNFEYCCYELQCVDVAALIKCSVRHCRWDIAVAMRIIEAYNSVRSLCPDECAIIYAILEFPQKFWRIANRYYNTRRAWSENVFLSKLTELSKEKDSHSKFIDELSQALG